MIINIASRELSALDVQQHEVCGSFSTCASVSSTHPGEHIHQMCMERESYDSEICLRTVHRVDGLVSAFCVCMRKFIFMCTLLCCCSAHIKVSKRTPAIPQLYG